MAFDTLTLEKGMYAHPTKSFSEILEELDPSENYRGTEYEGMDAFTRQLKRFDIKVSGVHSDQINKFFGTSSASVLFPEYLTRAVKQGVEETNMLDDIVATKTKINSLDYRTFASDPADSAKNLSTVTEGNAIPETSVSAQSHLVTLQKRGRLLVASYEAIQYQRLDLFTVMLRQIGAHIARQQFADAIAVITDGDGSENDNAATTVSSATADTLTYGDLLNLFKSLHPYEMNTLIVNPTMMTKIMSLDEFKNPLTGINFQGTGKPGNPLGAKLLVSSSAEDDSIIGLDKKCALEMVVAADVSVEYDRLIDRQLQRAAITSTAGFAKIFKDAAKILTI